MFTGDPSQSTKELLDEIKAEAVRGSQAGNLNSLMPAFTALLVKLSERADARARTMERLTIVLVVLTVVIALLTALLAWVTLLSSG
jgi:uncharacterized membrane protein